MKLSLVRWPSGQSCLNPLYHSWIVSSVYLVWYVRKSISSFDSLSRDCYRALVFQKFLVKLENRQNMFYKRTQGKKVIIIWMDYEIVHSYPQFRALPFYQFYICRVVLIILNCSSLLWNAPFLVSHDSRGGVSPRPDWPDTSQSARQQQCQELRERKVRLAGAGDHQVF